MVAAGQSRSLLPMATKLRTRRESSPGPHGSKRTSAHGEPPARCSQLPRVASLSAGPLTAPPPAERGGAEPAAPVWPAHPAPSRKRAPTPSGTPRGLQPGGSVLAMTCGRPFRANGGKPASGLRIPHAPPLNGKPVWPRSLVGIQGSSPHAPVTRPGLGVR